jgi:hypothetical protein
VGQHVALFIVRHVATSKQIEWMASNEVMRGTLMPS